MSIALSTLPTARSRHAFVGRDVFHDTVRGFVLALEGQPFASRLSTPRDADPDRKPRDRLPLPQRSKTEHCWSPQPRCREDVGNVLLTPYAAVNWQDKKHIDYYRVRDNEGVATPCLQWRVRQLCESTTERRSGGGGASTEALREHPVTNGRWTRNSPHSLPTRKGRSRAIR